VYNFYVDADDNFVSQGTRDRHNVNTTQVPDKVSERGRGAAAVRAHLCLCAAAAISHCLFCLQE
jgi:hypothetical protein